MATINYYSNPQLSKKYAEISFRKATLDQNKERIANALIRIALMESQLQNFNKAYELIDESIRIVKEELHDENLSYEYLFF